MSRLAVLIVLVVVAFQLATAEVCKDYLPWCTQGMCETGVQKAKIVETIQSDSVSEKAKTFQLDENYDKPLHELCAKKCGLCK
ncbi:unnamed protein product, partial [Mesorhabditis spiculigera]